MILKKNSTVLENALFAWKEMIALSWKSSYTDTTIVRGQPDTNWTYASGNTKNPLVWETFAHRIEYRPKGDIISKNFNSTPSYPFVNENEVDWNGINSSCTYFIFSIYFE